MNLTQKYVQSILRDRYQLKIGSVKSGPQQGRYLLLRQKPGTKEMMESDVEIAEDLGVSLWTYQRVLVHGLVEGTDYVRKQSYRGYQNIYFTDAKRCVTAMYGLYQSLERWDYNKHHGILSPQTGYQKAL